MKTLRFFVPLVPALVLAFVAIASACGGGQSEAEKHSNRGIELIEEGRYEEAIGELDEAIELDADLAVAYVSRGAAHGELGNLQQAIYDYDRAIDLDPSLAAAYASRGQAYSDLGNIQHAVADLEKALSLTVDSDVRAEIEERIAELSGQ